MSTPRAKNLLEDMAEACEFILQFTAGMDEQQFLGNVMAQHAVIRNIEVLGEAAKRFIDEVPDAASRFPHVPFAKMYVTRNRLIHGYSTLRTDTIWKIVAKEIPRLRGELDRILANWA